VGNYVSETIDRYSLTTSQYWYDYPRDFIVFYMGEPTIRIFPLLPHIITCLKQCFSQGSGLVTLLETLGNYVCAYLIGWIWLQRIGIWVYLYILYGIEFFQYGQITMWL